MDYFMEQIVIRKNRGLQEAMFFSSNIIMVIMAILGLMMLSTLLTSFTLFGCIYVLIMLGIATYLFFIKEKLRTEFEYTFTNGDLDFAQVFNNKKRKSLGTMVVKNVEKFGKVNSEEFRKLNQMPELVRRNWFLNRDNELYYFYYQKEGKRNMIVFEPSPDLVEMITKFLPNSILLGNKNI